MSVLSNLVIKNLKFLLDAQISGDNIAFLLDSGMAIEDAASDPRYLHSVAALLNAGVLSETIIPLMRAKNTIYRLFSADPSLMDRYLEYYATSLADCWSVQNFGS